MAAERRLRCEFAGARVLVAEDDESIRCVLAEFFADVGFVVATAVNGREACEAAGQQAFDLILLDVEMPEMNSDIPAIWHQPSLTNRLSPLRSV